MFKEIFTAEIWTTLGMRVAVFVLIMGLTYLINRLIRWGMARKAKLLNGTSIQYKFMSQLFAGFLYFSGFILAVYSIPELRGATASIFAGSGILAIIIGFASQQAFSNLVGGVFISIFKPFCIGDRIKFLDKNFIGVVEDITLRHTIIRTFENRRIIVPNSVISGETLVNENIVDKKILKFYEISISYESDVKKAMAILKEEALKNSRCIDNRSEEEKEAGAEYLRVRFVAFEESGLRLRANIWVATPEDAFLVGCELNPIINERFKQEGIEIPYPHRTIVYKKDTA